MAVRNPDDTKHPDSYNVIVGVDSFDRGLSRINMRWVVIGISGVMLFMVLLGFAFCLYSGIHHDKPRYFFLLSNLILSAVITGTLLFWLWRGTLSPGVAWYVFLQCFFLFFICITTDIFAWYAPNTEHEDSGPTVSPTPPSNRSNCTVPNQPNCTNNSNFATAELLWYFKP
ncbi:uncharacterized protein [Dysidea avara]|uniref:uncharacterized protein n=1 Tax=Dysidea avara TaxID=196820 RepID=UPI0033330599